MPTWPALLDRDWCVPPACALALLSAAVWRDIEGADEHCACVRVPVLAELNARSRWPVGLSSMSARCIAARSSADRSGRWGIDCHSSPVRCSALLAGALSPAATPFVRVPDRRLAGGPACGSGTGASLPCLSWLLCPRLIAARSSAVISAPWRSASCAGRSVSAAASPGGRDLRARLGMPPSDSLRLTGVDGGARQPGSSSVSGETFSPEDDSSIACDGVLPS